MTDYSETMDADQVLGENPKNFEDYSPEDVQTWFHHPDNEDFASFAHLFQGLKGSRVLGLSKVLLLFYFVVFFRFLNPIY